MGRILYGSEGIEAGVKEVEGRIYVCVSRRGVLKVGTGWEVGSGAAH